MAPVRHLPDDSFPFLTLSQRDRLLVHGAELHFEPDAVILLEGHRSRSIYVLMSGCVAVEKECEGVGVVLDELRPGAVFGEVSYLAGMPASASVVARTPVDVFVLEEIDELLASDTELAAGFYRSMASLLARRLRLTTRETARGVAAPVTT
jgi:extracellular factor (EF) 3-hydroxypalmitic acid methyl ester biosynthesis protein